MSFAHRLTDHQPVTVSAYQELGTLLSHLAQEAAHVHHDYAGHSGHAEHDQLLDAKLQILQGVAEQVGFSHGRDPHSGAVSTVDFNRSADTVGDLRNRIIEGVELTLGKLHGEDHPALRDYATQLEELLTSHVNSKLSQKMTGMTLFSDQPVTMAAYREIGTALSLGVNYPSHAVINRSGFDKGEEADARVAILHQIAKDLGFHAEQPTRDGYRTTVDIRHSPRTISELDGKLEASIHETTLANDRWSSLRDGSTQKAGGAPIESFAAQLKNRLVDVATQHVTPHQATMSGMSYGR